jgi:hypothetical protein
VVRRALGAHFLLDIHAYYRYLSRAIEPLASTSCYTAPSGEVLAVWVEGPFGPGTRRILSASFGDGRRHGSQVVGGPGDIDSFGMVLTPSGDGVATWAQGVGGSNSSVRANRYVRSPAR